MRNAATQSTPQMMVSEQLSDVQNQLKQVHQDIRVLDSRDQKRYQNLSQGQKIILSKVDQQFDTLMRIFTDEAKEGPRLFSFKPVEPGFFDRPKWISAKFQLTLWCEHSRQPLPELNPNNKKAGVYELTLSREWFIGAAPYLKFMTTTIGLISPIAASATKMILDDAAYNSISEELDLAQKSIDFSIKGMNTSVDWFGKSDDLNLEYGEYIRAEGSMLREVHTFLKKKDPSFGGLVRVQNKRQEFLWVHPDFVSEY